MIRPGLYAIVGGDMQPEEESAHKTVTGHARFDAIEQHPEYPALMRVKPSTIGRRMKLGFSIIFGIIFGSVGVFVFINVSQFRPLPNEFVQAFSGFLAIVGLGIVIWGFIQTVRFWASPLQSLPALVVDKRVRVRGGGQHSSASTDYYVTLEFRKGTRHEYETKGTLYGLIGRDDIGVAYLKGRYLLDYRRVPV